MKNDIIKITVPGQQTGPAILHAYLLDSISVAPEKKRPAIIVCAGGGYWNRSDRESEPIVLQFMAMGYHAFLLDYSVDPNHFPVSLLELAESVAVIRGSAAAWNVDETKIILCGFSAAGHLACSLGVFWNREFVYRPLGKTRQQIKPNGMILCYPVITTGEHSHANSFWHLLGEEPSDSLKEQVSLEKWVTEETPKAFIWHTYTDETVPLENSLLLAGSLRRHGVNFELHVYPTGPHGLSLANEETGGIKSELITPQCQSWIELVQNWIKSF